MELTKYTHSCIRLEKDGKVLVIDPGGWAEEAALAGADAVLVTHEHPDHLDRERLPADVPVWTNAAVAALLAEDGTGDRVTVVGPGQTFEAAGFRVGAYGNDHAIILPELGIPCRNTGFLVEDAVYHPGDSWTRPDRAVHTGLVPLAAPWFTMPDAIEYTRALGAGQVVGIHDAMLSEIGLGYGETWIGTHGRTNYRGMKPGDSIEIS
jgi:L-ascorbate metabolism protein UlaG (beta-lactamase superfamily)